MAAKRRQTNYRRNTRKTRSAGIPAWFWLLGGILIGLGAAVALMLKGYLPELQQHLPSVDETPPGQTEAALVEEDAKRAEKPKKPRYDFFTVLPEMEVVVPDQELSRKADKPEAPMDSVTGDALDSYILQVGSFRNQADAEQMKARLALLGSVATVQTVTVNGQTWHRVRIGPFEGARKADEIRRMLADNQIDTLVMKANP
ncbi:MAG: SPOR domain-containing protein [Gammaproteobacteria bacterium]|nr:SPOR domain-containing protein [Gammaproteobacteria bacterium]MBT8076268.1 SPOR domain-containing protein [Gammaproteobacteria bacterium]NNK99200.1 SPOR domain-containing protein [Xanthomonadales bacterium]